MQKLTDKEMFHPDRLTEAFLAAQNPHLMRLFILDLLTPYEIKQCTTRLYTAYKLATGASYRFLRESDNVCQSIIATTSRKLKNSQGGYNKILPRLHPRDFARFDEDVELEEFKKSLDL